VTSESLSITVAALPTVNLTPPAQSPIEGQPVNISALTAQRVACRVTMGEAMGTPPEAAGADAANANPAAKAK